MAVVLVAEDEAPVRSLVRTIISDLGHVVEEAANGHAAIELGRRVAPALAVLDYRLPGPDGLQVFRTLSASHRRMQGIMFTAYGSIGHAFECARAGMAAYLEKPIRADRLRATVQGILDAAGHPADGLLGSTFDGLVGDSAEMREVIQQIHQLAPLNETVLLIGESGTGKELVARALHARSPRSDGPFVDLNCAALPPSLFESELFGHERGAFTDAHARHLGHVEQATGGTLFLDEIGELAPESQAKLLRVVEQRSLRRVGSSLTVAVDCRLIAATNVDLAEAVQRHEFRADLFHRLNALTIRLSPLRDRLDDLPALAEDFLARLRQEHGRPFAVLLPNALERLRNHNWPGNVRELHNTLRQAFFAAAGTAISSDHIKLPAPERADLWFPPLPAGITLDHGLVAAEKCWIAAALAKYRSLSEAARALGIDRRTLYTKRGSHGL